MQSNSGEIHFTIGNDDSIPYLLCGGCGEPIEVEGDDEFMRCDPIGCDCQGSNAEYQLKHVE